MAHAAAATATVHAFHVRTTANAREETAAVVLSSGSRWISKTMKGSQVNILFISLLYIYIYIYIYIYMCVYVCIYIYIYIYG